MSTDVDLRQLAIERGDTSQPGLRTRRHVLTRYVLPGVLIVGFLLLVAWSSRDFVFPPRPVTVVPVLSTTSEVRQEGTPLFNAAGWIEPRPTPVRAAALAPGVVERLLVVEDQPVKAGEALAELVKDDAQLTLESAQADLKLREAELADAKAKLKSAQTRLAQPVHLEAALADAEASLAKVETLLKNLPFELRRAEAERDAAQQVYQSKLAAQGVVAGVDIDIAKSKADSAAALVEELGDRDQSLKREQAALSGRRSALETQLELLADELQAKEQAEAQVQAANARVEQTSVAVAEAQLQLERMTVRSPIDGRVFRLIAHPGARIGSGMTQMEGHDGSTVVTLYRPQMLQVRVDVRFEDIPKVTLDQPVRINNPALSSPLEGKVLFISSEADIQKNTLQVKVDIPNPPSFFKPEMLVDVTFLAPKQAERAAEQTQELKLYVLQQLVHKGEDGSYVWLADQSHGVARRAPIQTGAVGSGGLVEVTSGLTVSSKIIAGGMEGLQDGDRINVTSEDSTLGSGNAAPIGGDRSKKLNRLPAGETP